MDRPILDIKTIGKSFGGVKALQNVSFSLKRAEILSIVGENGAGKSTLMKIIAGAIKNDSGEIFLEDEPVKLSSPLDATKLGISIVFQEPNFFSDLSVLENIFCGNELEKKGGTLDWQEMYNQGAVALNLVGLDSSLLSKPMKDLSIGNQQLVLIARGIYKKCKILILDEPTSILSYSETEKLFSIISTLKENGVSILYISHRIPEILRISDRIIVLRDGHLIEEMEAKDADEEKIIAAMSGRKIDRAVFIERNYQGNSVILSVRDLFSPRVYKDISFDLKPGQVLGLYGLVGSGRSEIARAVFGETRAISGKIEFEGEDITNLSTQEIIQKRIHYVPEDRGIQGLFSDHTIAENMSIAFIDEMSNKLGFIDMKQETDVVQKNIDLYRIKTESQKAVINSLSGGSQQKVLFCRWLLEEPKVLILDEPTRGIDVMTKSEIHRLIMQLALKNVAILLISSDLPEVMELSDEILTLRKGHITHRFSRQEATEEEILKYSLGLNETKEMV